MQTLSELATAALNDVKGVFAHLPDDSADALIEALKSAKKIVVFGLGREGLQMRGLRCGCSTWASTSPSGAT